MSKPIKVEVVPQRLTWWKVLLLVAAVTMFFAPGLWLLFSIPK